MNTDPRTEHFSALVLNAGRTLPGVWRLMHIGFGEHLFVDKNTGDAVPITSVSQAVRLREDEPAARGVGSALVGIDTLGLSTRAFNLLKREDVDTVGDLLSFFDRKGTEGLDAMRNMRPEDRDEIVAQVSRLRGHDYYGGSQ